MENGSDIISVADLSLHSHGHQQISFKHIPVGPIVLVIVFENSI